MALIVANDISRKPVEQWKRYDDETEVLLRGIDNDSYHIGLARARRQINKADSSFMIGEVDIAEGEISEHAYQCKLLSKFIVQDWRGAKDASGTAIPYSATTCEATLAADIGFFIFVVKAASEIAADAEKERSETLGKSLPVTDGKSKEID